MMHELQEIAGQEPQRLSISINHRLEIVNEGIRKGYLSRLSDMDIVPWEDDLSLEEDLIHNIRIYQMTEMVYQKGERVLDKIRTVYNTISTYNASVFIILDSDGFRTKFYLGVRNNEPEESPLKRSTVTLGDTLKNTLIGHFPGVKLQHEDRSRLAILSDKIKQSPNLASVSVVGNDRLSDKSGQEQFVQGLEKLVLAMEGRSYTGILLAQNQSSSAIQQLRNDYQNLYTNLSPFQRVQESESQSESLSSALSFSEMTGKQKAALIGSAALGLAGTIGGAVLSGGEAMMASGAMLGGQIVGPLNGLISSLAPNQQKNQGSSHSVTTTYENKAVTDMLALIDSQIQRTNEFDSFGLWQVAAYFLSDDMATAEIAASNYRSLMNGEDSGREVSAVNSWRQGAWGEDYWQLTTHLSRFVHPKFYYDTNHVIVTSPATQVSGEELGIHLGLPRTTIAGLPVIEHAEFGKEVHRYRLVDQDQVTSVEERVTLGRIFDLGQVTDKPVELYHRSLNMHTFITGSTGSGKSNTVYQLLNELYQDGVPFLVVEPAKGEYKDVFGHWEDVHVFSTNPAVSDLIQLNPFQFPESIHVLEHVDGLVEIFGVCWPMYDAMSAFLKEAILKSYEEVGWDLVSSTVEGMDYRYPDFELVAEQLEFLIEETDYSAEVKGNYTGALLTRIRSLTVGLNKMIFGQGQTPYEQLFDENCILDISQIKSMETKALIMGLMVYLLNEYRMDQKIGSNTGLQHVTVLEEAHNLLKNVSGVAVSDLQAKSVELLTNTIAEIRTYGEGFIIVDQSPSSVDSIAIKNTNTKIVLRTPEINDRQAVGRSMGLTEDQVNEIAKLPSGVAVVYQNDWLTPVLAIVDKAEVTEIPFGYNHDKPVRTIRQARYDVISLLAQPWLGEKELPKASVWESFRRLELGAGQQNLLKGYIEDYYFFGGYSIWKEDQLPVLQELLRSILGLSKNRLHRLFDQGQNVLREAIQKRTLGFTSDEVKAICHILTRSQEDDRH